ncbi:MAG TPA: hypothetical protein VK654_00700 [Nitrospirota bacterium]|nr:hypothetical protein [Nitrospirota bacterium]
MQATKSAGSSIDSYCGKCKLNLDHTVMTMDGETISKVRCKTCGSMHKFRGVVDTSKVRKPRTKTSAAEEAATAEIVWEAGLTKAKGKEREYDMAAKYSVGDVVNHATFGKGIVVKIHVNKCDMLFKDKERLMASANL